MAGEEVPREILRRIKESRLLRRPATLGLLLAVLAGFVSASPGETIYLKSGISLRVTKAEEKDGQIEYWIGRDHYSISKDRVLKIEKEDAPVTPPAAGASSQIQDLTHRATATAPAPHEKVDLPRLLGPKQDDAYWTGLRERIMVRDTILDQHLAEIARENDNGQTANAFFLAAVIEMQRGNSERAAGYLDYALRAAPDRVELYEWQAIALTRSGRLPEAARALEHAATLEPNSPQILRMLGMTRYNSDRTADAISAWKRAQELAPDPQVAALLRKAEREMQVEDKLRSQESRHFTLRYEGQKTAPGLQQEVLASLEASYGQIARQLDYEPRENMIAILYTQKEFRDITGAPSWSGALNDGKLRIPLGGIGVMNAELDRVLRHELTHSFVFSICGPHCPVWLHEGLAQLMEPRSAAQYARELGPAFRERKAVPFSLLEDSFMGLSNLQAEIAYAESLAAVEYLRDRYGMGEIVKMMESIASGVQPETALKNSTGTDYSVLQQRIGEHFAKAE